MLDGLDFNNLNLNMPPPCLFPFSRVATDEANYQADETMSGTVGDQSEIDETRKAIESTTSDLPIVNPSHECTRTSCKCMIPDDKQFCGDYCQSIEESSDIALCGCGHTDCDYTKQVGNIGTFSPTAS